MEHNEFTIAELAFQFAGSAESFPSIENEVKVAFGGVEYTVILSKIAVGKSYTWELKSVNPRP
jgi:hypothetical protein